MQDTYSRDVTLMAKIVFDSSTIISLSESCLFHILKKISTELSLEFYIPKGVEFESVTRPRQINRFKLSSVRIGDGIKEGWIKVWKDSEKIQEQVKQIQEIANNIYSSDEGKITIMHMGEAECLALIMQLQSELIGIDERT